ncbi:MAG: hypothetical protein KF709_14480 [Gemmatimonadaceae bacterium]|nr:hypothetical protein [Gemmatimonadaceae bacterium]
MRRILLLATAALLIAAPSDTARAQATSPAAQTPPPSARPADVESIDAIMAAVYDVISGPAGQKRDWDRFRALFVPGARLIYTGKRPNGEGGMLVWNVDEYITRNGPGLERGFFERELGRKVERYGNIVHLMSAYDSKRTLEDAAPFARGINSFQLWYDGKRWWVVTIYWEAETPANPIPAEYLTAKP